MKLLKVAAPLLAVGLVVAACSGAAVTTVTAPPATAVPASVAPASAAPASSAPTAAPASAPPSTAGGGGYDTYGKGSGSSPAAASVSLAKTSLGTVLIGAGGKTLYVFLADSAGTSACTGSCATNWPPLAGDKPVLGAGLVAADFGSITRADGTAQVTFHGQPLYYFAGDQAAGQTNGQGIGGKWYVVGADGKPIK